jgi:hypothetical protein
MDRMSKAPAEGRVAHLASIWQVIDRCLREVDDELKDLYPSLSFLEVVGYEVGPVLYAIMVHAFTCSITRTDAAPSYAASTVLTA